MICSQGLEAGEEGVGVVENLLEIMFSVLKEGEGVVDSSEHHQHEGDKKKLTLLLKQVITLK